MKTSTRSLITLLFLLTVSMAQAQNAEMADTFRADGKIYVVVAIILIVLTGLILYLFLLDRKLNKLEESIKVKRQTKSTDKAF